MSSRKNEVSSLIKLVSALETIDCHHLNDCPIGGITDDSNTVKPGDIFVAIKGLRVDGHQYINEAIKRGAGALVVEDDDIKDVIPTIVVSDARVALAQLANAFYDKPSQQLKVIGVTGTTGKTTTTFMLDHIFSYSKKRSGIIGTLQRKIDQCIIPSYTTTPNPPELQGLLREMIDHHVEVVSMEVSSHGLVLHRVNGIDFDIGIFTNITKDHLSFHENFTNYLNAKSELFVKLKKEGYALFNLDDPFSYYLMQETRANILTFGMGVDADLAVQNIRLHSRGSQCDVILHKEITALNGKRIKPFTQTLNLNILGKHNIYNALGAFLAGLIYGLMPHAICEALESFDGVKRRMQIVYDKDFLVLDDFAHNIGSMTSVFETIQGMDYKQLIIVNFLKGSRGVEANKINAELISRWAKRLKLKQLITTRSESRVLKKNIVFDDEEEVYNRVIKNHNISVVNTKELEEAIKLALEWVQQDDIILLLGTQGIDAGAEIVHNLLKEDV